MKAKQYRMKILNLLYSQRILDPLEAMDCEDLARQLNISWEQIRPEMNYLEEKGYIALNNRQLRSRIFCTVYLTTKGVDFVEAERPKEQALKISHSLIPFKLQLSLKSDSEFEVRALETPLGEPYTISRLPYTLEELDAILKALYMPKYEHTRFTPEQRNILEQRGLLRHSRFVPNLSEQIGQDLYNALMVGDVHTAFQMSLTQARSANTSVSMQLRFDEHNVKISRYPWELLYYRRALLPSRAIELMRYISYPEMVNALSIESPLQLLYIKSRPTNLSILPSKSEQTAIKQALKNLQKENTIKVDSLSQSTYEALLDYLEASAVHILHFDGHGVFARQCPECDSMNYPHLVQCAFCKQEITDIEPQGYLAFENKTKYVQWISSKTFSTLLYNRLLRLIVLSACWSSRTGGETLFGGMAPSLIQAGIPAVVAMQLPISVEVAIKFMQGFYSALARFDSIPAAVNAGRLRIINTREWFIPTLYLRSRNDEGDLL